MQTEEIEQLIADGYGEDLILTPNQALQSRTPSISVNGCTLELADDGFEICCGPQVQVTPVEGGFQHVIHDSRSGRTVTFTAKSDHSFILNPVGDNSVAFSGVDVFDRAKTLGDIIQDVAGRAQ